MIEATFLTSTSSIGSYR